MKRKTVEDGDNIGRKNTSNFKILMIKVINMTILFKNNQDKTAISSKDLMQMNRERIHNRRLRKGSLISGQILSTASFDNIIELYPAEHDMAI